MKIYLSICIAGLLLLGCQKSDPISLNPEVMASLGTSQSTYFSDLIKNLRLQVNQDSTDEIALRNLAENNIILYIFGFTSRNETLPEAQEAFALSSKLDSTSSEYHRLAGILSFLNWEWENTEKSLTKSIQTDPTNRSARHWYSLYLMAMKRVDEAMAQSDTIMTMDPEEDYLIGRGSLLYFQDRYDELKNLMLLAIGKDPTVPWGYDWLGMAYNGLGEHEMAIKTYLQAFELSDGTVEVGGGLGHALADAGKIEVAQELANYYQKRAKRDYLPPVQRAFIHIGLDQKEVAIKLLEQAYREQSWFLIFIQIEPWYNPLRNEPQFEKIIQQMNFPEK